MPGRGRDQDRGRRRRPRRSPRRGSRCWRFPRPATAGVRSSRRSPCRTVATIVPASAVDPAIARAAAALSLTIGGMRLTAPRQDRRRRAQVRARRVPDRPRAVPRGAAGSRARSRSGATPRRRAPCGCASRWRTWARCSSSSGRCSRRGATSCRPTSPTSSRSCRTGCRRSRRSRCVAILDARSTASRSTQVFRSFDRDADRERVGRAGALRRRCPTARRSRSRCCGPNIAHGDREGHRRCCTPARR